MGTGYVMVLRPATHARPIADRVPGAVMGSAIPFRGRVVITALPIAASAPGVAMVCVMPVSLASPVRKTAARVHPFVATEPAVPTRPVTGASPIVAHAPVWEIAVRCIIRLRATMRPWRPVCVIWTSAAAQAYGMPPVWRMRRPSVPPAVTMFAAMNSVVSQRVA